jgi:hypothetical protein
MMADLHTDRAYLREIWRLSDYHQETHRNWLGHRSLSGQCRLFGFEDGATAPIEVTLVDVSHLDWTGPSEGENRGPCIRDGEKVVYRLFVDRADWACPMCAGTESKSPLPRGKELDAALDEFAKGLGGDLPGRNDLFRLIQGKLEFRNATWIDVRRLRKEFASEDSKKGGARFHRSRRG